jgi:hypothetical protein
MSRENYCRIHDPCMLIACFGRIGVLVNIMGLKIPSCAESTGYMPEYRQAGVRGDRRRTAGFPDMDELSSSYYLYVCSIDC